MRKIKRMLALWLAHKTQRDIRRRRRVLRDQVRREEVLLTRAGRRARGLRLYAAWSKASPDAQPAAIASPSQGLAALIPVKFTASPSQKRRVA